LEGRQDFDANKDGINVGEKRQNISHKCRHSSRVTLRKIEIDILKQGSTMELLQEALDGFVIMAEE
jgi:hypothetical protein